MTVSTIIPFFNLERYARQCLESVAAAADAAPQTQLRAICVNDGSTDGTGAILDEFAARDPRFYVVHKANGGEGSARNAGLAAADGEWITFLDGDDVWLPGILCEFTAAAKRHGRGIDAIAFAFAPFSDGGEPPHSTPAQRESRIDLRREIPSEAISAFGVFPTFFRRERFHDLKFTSLPLGADRLYAAQCLATADEIVLSDAVTLGYRVRSGSMARAPWDAKKIVSMLDYATGSLKAISASGRTLGADGIAYFASVLLSIAPKKMKPLRDGRKETVRHWRESLAALDPFPLPLRYRIVKALSRFYK